MRRFVIGDIHGCSKALRALVEAIDPTAEDELVFLGDYIDRGPDSRDVIDQLIALRDRCNVVTLRGNHEIMLLGVALHNLDPDPWLRSGGQATVTSYGGSLDKIPADHLAFFQDLRPFYETSDAIFVHAGYQPDVQMTEQDDATTYWGHLPIPPPPPHSSGKRVFVGHTPQPSGNVLDVGHLICVDTYCFGGGFLTALNPESYEIIQANWHGHLRRAPLAGLIERVGKLRQFFAAKLAAKKQTSGKKQSPPSDMKATQPQSDLSEAAPEDSELATASQNS